MNTVLLLEDDQVSAMLLQSILEEAGYKVFHALDTDTAVNQLKTLTPDIFLSDWRVDGTTPSAEVACLVRQKNPSAKIAFITGYPPEYLTEPLKDAKPFKIFSKPIDFDKLILEIPSLP